MKIEAAEDKKKDAGRPSILELDIEELEEKIAPGRGMNHNETLVRD